MASKRPDAKRKTALPARDLKLLWALAGSSCSPCARDLVATFEETGEKVVVGEHAHTEPHSSRGPRGIKRHAEPDGIELAIDARGPVTYENSILVCGACHAVIDGAPQFHTLGKIRELKLIHERRVTQRREQEHVGYNIRIVINKDVR